MEAISGMANLIAMVTGMYVYIFVAMPLTEGLYKRLEPPINSLLRRRKEKKESC
jgi:hypothetical protein